MLLDIPQVVNAAIMATVVQLRSRFNNRLLEIILFGSYALKNYNDGSDVDLCIIIDELTHAERSEAIEIVAEVGINHDILLAPLVWSLAEWQTRLAHEQALAHDIKQYGIHI